MAKYTTIVTLVSEQAVPSVIFIMEYIKINPGTYKLLFLSTDRMEKSNASQNLVDSIRLSCNNAVVKTDVLKISHDDYGSIVNSLKENIPDEGEYIVNITGGTKVMSIAVFSFFTKNNILSNSRLYYLTLGKNNFVELYPHHKMHNIKSVLSLKEYLTAYGIRYKFENKFLCTWEQNNNFALIIFEKYRDMITKLVKFQKENYVKSKFKRKQNLDLKSNKVIEYLERNNIKPDSLRNLLKDAGFQTKELSRKELRYLTGGWFEEFTYQKIKNDQNIPNTNIALNVIYENTDSSEPYGSASNELDVLYINNKNGISIVECKSTISNQEKLFNNTVYKMSALRKQFGLPARSYLYTMSIIDKDIDINRAQTQHITLIDRNALFGE